MEVDDKFTVGLHECQGVCGTKPPGMYPLTQNATVWRKSGGGFAGLGGGVMIPVGPKQGVVAEIKILALFPNTGFAVSPSIGYAFGL